MTKASQPAGILSLYSGQTCIGWLISRGKCGVEAFDAADKSLGTFPDQEQAVRAVTAHIIEAERPGG